MELVRRKFAQVLVVVCSGACAFGVRPRARRDALRHQPAPSPRRNRIKILLLAIAWGGLASAAAGQIPCAYQISTVIEGPKCQILGQSSLQGQAINSKSHVAGRYQSCVNLTYPEAFVWTPEGGLFTIPRPANVAWAVASDISDDDIVVGTCAVGNNDGPLRGFLYDLKTKMWAELPPVNGIGWSQAIAINSQNVVCGYRSLGNPGTSYPWQAFIWSPENGGTFTDLGVMNGPASEAVDITDNGLVVGTTGNSLATDRAFVYNIHTKSLQILPPIPNGLSSAAAAISSAGVVVGYGRPPEDPPFVQHAFVYESATKTFTVLPPPECRDSHCVDVNSSGLIIGGFPCESVVTPFIWQDDRLVDLNNLAVTSEPLILDWPTTIRDDGTIVATARYGVGLPAVAIILSPHFAPRSDIDGNCAVNMDDLLAVISAWGQTASPADVDGDGIVSVGDLMAVIREWTFE